MVLWWVLRVETPLGRFLDAPLREEGAYTETESPPLSASACISVRCRVGYRTFNKEAARTY